jgi:hypothetical protein
MDGTFNTCLPPEYEPNVSVYYSPTLAGNVRRSSGESSVCSTIPLHKILIALTSELFSDRYGSKPKVLDALQWPDVL